jgi:copper resistance protein B
MKKALQVVTLAGLAFGAASAGAQEHDMSGMQGGSPPPDARDPHAYSGGQDFGPLGRPHMGDQHPYGAFLADHLEAAHGRDNSEFVYDLQAWYGGNYNRAVLKAEGDVDGGRLQDARTELLWSHAIASYWDVQAGLRVDHGEASQRNWLAVGVQGLAPYWFEVDVAAYLGEHGRTALRAEAEYELLLTQRLILQPRIEANLYGRRDAAREIGSGLSDLVAGLRLRYEITRQFAPYVGVEWAASFGGSADLAREAGERTRDTRWVMGLRMWF